MASLNYFLLGSVDQNGLKLVVLLLLPPEFGIRGVHHHV